MDAREAFYLADQHTDDAELDTLLSKLLTVPSVHTAQLEADPNVKAFVAEVVAPRLEDLTGISPWVDGMGNLLWQAGPEPADGEGLLLMGYAMTFPAGSMREPFSGEIVAGEPYGLQGPCIWGRGGSEQKAPLAAMLVAAAAVARSGCRLVRPLCLAVSLAGETGRHDAAQYMLGKGLRTRHAIVGLGTSNRVCLGNKGRIDVDIVVRGKSCHSSTPSVGLNAVDGARMVLDRLDGLTLGREHSQLGAATLVATRIESGPAILHTIQDVCRITLDRRLLPGEHPNEAFEAIRGALEDLAPWQIEVTQGAFMHPSSVAESCEIALALAAANQAAGKRNLPVYFPAALDAGYLNHEGVEAVMFGPGDLRFAHTDEEVVSLEDLRCAARIYAAAALTVLA